VIEGVAVDVGYTVGFQNPDNLLSDRTVYENDLHLVDLAVDLGFDAVWVVEHHFTDYFMSPDPLQFLTWVAARHPNIRVGTGVIVLPWHEPVRCAEQIALLDNLSGGLSSVSVVALAASNSRVSAFRWTPHANGSPNTPS
jgi:alkanesulfonate monooxygenase SsuD/methylene tetrahydromethanopterin reductase-like flavin-dependent oxidoreductase (luciferase family)